MAVTTKLDENKDETGSGMLCGDEYFRNSHNEEICALYSALSNVL